MDEPSKESIRELFVLALDRALAAGGPLGPVPLIEPGERVLIACSGGPDSTALAFALAEVNERYGRGLALELAHLHHGLRGVEADLDCEFASGVARRLGLPFHERRVDIEGVAGRDGLSIETCARRERYRFLEETARANGIGKIATGHHLDDHVETVVFRILRGTGIRGLVGIPPRRRLGGRDGPEVVRPLLGIPRARVRAYLDAVGIEARTDRTNLVADAARNRLRLELLPFLRGFAPRLDRAIERLSRAAAQASEILESEAVRRLDAAGIAPQLPVRLPLRIVFETPPPLRPILLMRAVERATGLQLRARHAEQLLRLVAAKGPGASVDLPGDVRATREYQAIVVAPRPAPAHPGEAAAPAPPPAAVRIAVPGRTEAPELGVAVETHVGPAGALGPAHAEPAPAADPRFCARFDLAQLPGPLLLRRPRPGDFFYPRGGPGKKKLQDFFVDQKVPRPERASTLILEAGGQVAWVVGHRLDRRFAAGELTGEALEVCVVPLAR